MEIYEFAKETVVLTAFWVIIFACILSAIYWCKKLVLFIIRVWKNIAKKIRSRKEN